MVAGAASAKGASLHPASPSPDCDLSFACRLLGTPIRRAHPLAPIPPHSTPPPPGDNAGLQRPAGEAPDPLHCQLLAALPSRQPRQRSAALPPTPAHTRRGSGGDSWGAAEGGAGSGGARGEPGAARRWVLLCSGCAKSCAGRSGGRPFCIVGVVCGGSYSGPLQAAAGKAAWLLAFLVSSPASWRARPGSTSDTCCIPRCVGRPPACSRPSRRRPSPTRPLPALPLPQAWCRRSRRRCGRWWTTFCTPTPRSCPTTLRCPSGTTWTSSGGGSGHATPCGKWTVSCQRHSA